MRQGEDLDPSELRWRVSRLLTDVRESRSRLAATIDLSCQLLIQLVESQNTAALYSASGTTSHAARSRTSEQVADARLRIAFKRESAAPDSRTSIRTAGPDKASGHSVLPTRIP